MKDAIDYLKDGNLWMAYILLIASLFAPWLKEDFKSNPRQKHLPVWYSTILLIVILLSSFNLLSIQKTWTLIAVGLVVFIYLYILNTTVKVSYEALVLKRIEKRLRNTEIDDYKEFYLDNRKWFLTQLGKYNYGMMCLDYLSHYGDISSCFEIMDGVNKLKLTNEERRRFLIQQFYIYNLAGAIKIWEDKYDSIENLFNEDDKLFVNSIISYYKLDLDLSEEYSRKLLASTTNDSYKQIAENNIAVVAENKAQKIEWCDYSHKSYHSSKMIKSNIDITSPNLVHNYMHNGKLEKAEEIFQKYIKSLPSATINQRVRIANEKLMYYRQLNDNNNTKIVIESLFEEYRNASPPKKYFLLVSLLRISFNHQFLFEEMLTEMETYIDNLLKLDFALVVLVIREIRGVWRSLVVNQNRVRIALLVDKCSRKLKTIDIDDEISRLRIEEVNIKREYIRFELNISMNHMDNENAEQYKHELYKKFEVLDELIIFDERRGTRLDLLHSLFFKLDEVTDAIGVFRFYFKISDNSDIFRELNTEGHSLISRILPIMQKANKAKMMAEYHLQLAFHYCRLNNKADGYKHFQIFKNSNVSIFHFASWLRDWYWKLEGAFNNEAAF